MEVSIEFNNAGVTLLNNGEREKAEVMFKGALEVITTGSRKPHSQSTNDTDNKRGTMHGGNGSFHHDWSIIERAEALLHQTIVERIESRDDTTPDTRDPSEARLTTTNGPRDPFVYQHPFRVQETCHSAELCLATIASIVMYNVALVDHLTWLETPYGNSKLLVATKVLRFYEMAYDIAPGRITGRQEVPMKDSVARESLFRLALLNNIGQILHELGQYDIARIYVDKLANMITDLTISSLPPSPVSASSDVRTFEHCLGEFNLNVMLLQLPKSAPAA